MTISHQLRLVLLAILWLFILVCILSCNNQPTGKTVLIVNPTQSDWLIHVESPREFAAVASPSSADLPGNWNWERGRVLPAGSQLAITLPRGTYQWYASIPYKAIRGGTLTLEDSTEQIALDTSALLFDFRQRVAGVYSLNCNLKRLDEQSLQITDSSFSYLLPVEEPMHDFQQIRLENRIVPLTPDYKFDYRQGPIDLVTGRFFPNKRELKMRITTQEHITPFRTCFCKGKKIDIIPTNP